MQLDESEPHLPSDEARSINEDFLTPAEFAALAPRTSVHMVRRWIRDGKLIARKNLSGYYLVPRSELRKVLQQAAPQAPPPSTERSESRAEGVIPGQGRLWSTPPPAGGGGRALE